MHLFPGSIVIVLKRAPFLGPLLIDSAGEHHALAFELAEQLLVTDISDAMLFPDASAGDEL
jgi:hypothetical protein